MLFTAGLLRSFSFFSASNSSLSKGTELGVPSTICEEKRRAANKSSSIACTSINQSRVIRGGGTNWPRHCHTAKKGSLYIQTMNVICWKKKPKPYIEVMVLFFRENNPYSTQSSACSCQAFSEERMCLFCSLKNKKG